MKRAEFNAFFWPKPKPKINSAECVAYVGYIIQSV